MGFYFFQVHNFGNRIKGITLRRWTDNTPYIILFSRERGPYIDRISGNILYYDREGQHKDQEPIVRVAAFIITCGI